MMMMMMKFWLVMGTCMSRVSHTENFNYTTRQPGSTSGLQLGLHVNQDNYMIASSASTGFRVSKPAPLSA